MRHAAEIGVHADRHDAGRLRTLRVKPVELCAAAMRELLGGVILDGEHHHIVRFNRIRQRYHRARLRLDGDRLIIEYPVRHVLDPFRG